MVSSTQPPLSMSPYRSNVITSTQTSPSAHSISGAGSQSLTISSLRGNYLYVVVQVTRDSVPVVFSKWRLPESNYNLGVCDVTLDQFEALADRMGRSVDLLRISSITDWPALVENSMLSLAQLLTVSSNLDQRWAGGLLCSRSSLRVLVSAWNWHIPQRAYASGIVSADQN